jgi:hypothetical protein
MVWDVPRTLLLIPTLRRQPAVRRFFKECTVFHGRASRSEYWWWTLVSVGVSVILNVIIGAGTAATTFHPVRKPDSQYMASSASVKNWVGH